MSDDADFAEHFAIYLHADQTLATIADWLGQRMPTATMSTDGKVSVERRTQSPSVLRLSLNAAPSVRAEIVARAKRGNAVLRNALRTSTQRLDLAADDERTKFDDLYDVFRAITAMPNAVAVVESDNDSFVEFFVGESEAAICTVDQDD